MKRRKPISTNTLAHSSISKIQNCVESVCEQANTHNFTFHIKSFHSQLFSWIFTHTHQNSRISTHAHSLCSPKHWCTCVHYMNILLLNLEGKPFKIAFKCQPLMPDNVIYNAISFAHVLACSRYSSIFCTKFYRHHYCVCVCVIFAVLCVSYTT